MSTSYAYEQYFGLVEHPFSITPDPRFVYLSDSHREALEHLKYGAAGGVNGFVLLTGDVGTGKTTICRTFLEGLPPKTEVALILNPVLTLNEFLQTICDEFNLVIEGNRESNKNLIDQLNRFLLQVYAVGQKTILIIDEAQNLTQDLLEQIRLLTNLETNTDKLLQIFLIGQPELREMLKRREMLQVSQRITSRYHLGPLNKRETGKYIYRRLEVAGPHDIDFTESAIRGIYAFSKGVPRLINVLCDKALISAYENSTNKIDGKIIRDAQRRVLGNVESGPGNGILPKAAAILGAGILLAAVSLGAGYWMNVANLRPWIDTRLAEIQGTDGLVPAELIAPPVVPAPAGSTAPSQPLQASRAESVDVATEVPAGNPATPIENAAGIVPIDRVVPEVAATIAAEPTPAPTPIVTETEPPQASPVADAQAAATDQTPAQEFTEAGRTPASEQPVAVSRVENADDDPRVATAHKDASPPQPSPDTRSLAAMPADQSLADYTRRYAERKLLAMWGINDTQGVGLDFCESAARQGLICLTEASGLPGLYLLDRPAILFLRIAEVSSYAVVLKANRDSVVLDVLDQEHVIPANALREVWDGNYLLLWRKPANVDSHLTQGATGRSIVWLRRAIDHIEGTNTTGDLYDQQLVERVKTFQRTVGLMPDGIVGPRTLILLQNKLAEKG